VSLLLWLLLFFDLCWLRRLGFFPLIDLIHLFPHKLQHAPSSYDDIHADTHGITAAAPKCGAAAPRPAYFHVTHPSTHPSRASIVAIVAAALRSRFKTKMALMMPNARLRPPMHCTKPEAKVLSAMGMPKREAIVVGLRSASAPVLRRKAVIE
jgi:hypothetical protein